MKFSKFLKEKMLYIILLLVVIIMVEILLLPYEINLWVRIYAAVVPLIFFLIPMLIEYRYKNEFYLNLKNNLEKLKQKYLISEIVNTPNFIEGQILKETMQEAGKSMLENVNEYKHEIQEYKEYIEMWIHEIKTPIAVSKMVAQNNKTDVTKSIEEELDKIDNYTEQALFYARSNTVEKDYIITKTNLEEIAKEAILKNKNILLSNKVTVDLHDMEQYVYTDGKWIVFIISQIIQNAVKYSKGKTPKIEIYCTSNKENINMYIKDNGIGIIKEDISRVFEKGFTGANGRNLNQKSTGIGLYLCKKLCDKLRISINISSKKDAGTEVELTFPKGTYTTFE